MKNTQTIALFMCICIFILSLAGIILFMESKIFAGAFLSIFIAASSFTITFLFLSRYKCMNNMIKGIDLVAYWQYSPKETQLYEQRARYANKGRIIMAIPFFSFVLIVIILTMGFASDNHGMGLLSTVVIITLNVIFLKFFVSAKMGNEPKVHNININKSYVYITPKGIYAHGLLHVWKGWGSKLRKVLFDEENNTLYFIYTYLKPYGFGEYTIEIKVPKENRYCIDKIKWTFPLIYNCISENIN